MAARGDVIDAGLIGSEFKLDPVLILGEPDRRRHAIRVAAFMAVQTAKAKAEAEAATKAR